MRSKRKRAVQGQVILDAEQERRYRSRMRRVLWWRIGAVMIAVATVAGVIGLYFSPAVRVQNVEVTGAQTVDAQEVLSMLDLEGDSMLRVDAAGIARRVETLPMVYTASVERAWPQTVRIRITERSPWGYWKSGGTLYAIDQEGVVLEGATPPEGATVIEDTGSTVSLSPGDRVDGDAVFLTQVLRDRIPETVSATVGAIEWSPELGISLETSAGYRVVIGDSQNFDYKLSLWHAVEEEMGVAAMAGHVLDLRFGDRPALMKGGDES